jgi:hypothetical protein
LPGQEGLLREIVNGAEVTLEAVAAPGADQSAAIAKSMQAPPAPDLRRHLLASPPAVLLLLADEPPDPTVHRAAAEVGARTVALEPGPADENGGDADFAPRMRCSPGFLAAMDVLPELGPVRCASMISVAPPGHGTLAARLFDAMHVLDTCAADVEIIEAALSRPQPTVPEHVAALRGHLTANLRLAEHRSASVLASDEGGRWQRRLTLIGERGTLEITDGGFAWHEGGELVDEHPADMSWDCASLLAWHLRRLLDREDTTDPPADRRRLTALCEATRLSCRTGQGESPSRMMEMISRGVW